MVEMNDEEDARAKVHDSDKVELSWNLDLQMIDVQVQVDNLHKSTPHVETTGEVTLAT